MFTDDHAKLALHAAARAAGTDGSHVLEIARQRRASGFATWFASLFAVHLKGENNDYSQATARVGRHDPDLVGRGR
jgi:hypothetical protein